MLENLIHNLNRAYQKYPKKRIFKYLKHFPEYILLFIHVFFLDKIIKKINYKIWHYLKDKMTFIKKARLFIEKDFYITIPPYIDIYRYGAYIHTLAEYKLTKFIVKNINQIKIFFDIGANYGYYSFLITEINKSSQAYAFEPNLYALKILNLNKNKRINIIPKAVGSENRKIKFERGHYVNSLSTNVITNENIDDFIEVEMITLDSFSSNKKLIPDFIKIDVEKIEVEVIKGAQNLLKLYRPMISLEIYLNERYKEYIEGLKILKNLNYHIFYIDENGDIEKFRYEDFFIFNNISKNLIFDNFIFLKNDSSNL